MVVCGRSYVSGSAFKLVNKRAYHHGTMLIDAKLGDLRGVLGSQRVRSPPPTPPPPYLVFPSPDNVCASSDSGLTKKNVPFPSLSRAISL